MRHIAIDTFTPSTAWQQRAQDATNELLGKTSSEERVAYINANSEIWKNLGRELIAHFGHKCWYTDATNYGARLDVEHFRPKAKTIELTTDDCKEAADSLLLKLPEPRREGYWWLAFHADNLMLCAQVMNREEKRNFFPLHKNSPVASGINQNAWRSEIPAFLDPRKLDDVLLVDYDETGAMRPRDGVDLWDRLRVVITNECFGLSRFQPLTEGRQRMWQKCTDLIEQYIRATKKQSEEHTPDSGLQQQKNDALAGLQKLLDPREEFSTIAASCMRNSPFKWAAALASLPHGPMVPSSPAQGT
jgi:hypothetical protein